MSGLDYLHKDFAIPALDHPDSAIRLASVVHRFRVPRITRTIDYRASFRTVGQHPKTKKVLQQADDTRSKLQEGLRATPKVSCDRITSDAKRYLPLVNQILLSCKIQPEDARLDEKLIYEWGSGIEKAPEKESKEKSKDKGSSATLAPGRYRSEAIMYDVVMTVVCEGLGNALGATEFSVAGEFVSASRSYAVAAGIFDHLSNTLLPQWIAKGGTKVDNTILPVECHIPTAKALSQLFCANGQQMAVATVLMKPTKPNYSLVAKLCYGIMEQMETFVSTMRTEAFSQLSKFDKDFLTLITFQINLQKSLSLYFQGRAAWDQDQYGMGIALLSEATVALRTRSHMAANGLPDLKGTVLEVLQKDLTDLRQHMQALLSAWEKDNNQVYFDKVPQHIPAGSKLQEGIQLNKKEPYKLDDVEPFLLVLPDKADDGGSTSETNRPLMDRSDSDLARELQRRLNAGLDD
jgi:BRO1-like domain